MTARAAVLGAGPWGATFAWLLARNGADVNLWTRDEVKRAALHGDRRPPGVELTLPDNVAIVDSLEQAVDAELLLFAVQPGHVRDLAKAAAPFLRPEQMAVHLVKGFEPGGSPVSGVLDDETLLLRVGAIAGPVVPSELWAGQDGAAVVGSEYQEVIDAVTELLASEHLRVYGNRDLLGVEIAGAMRTPLALAAGMVRELGLGRTIQAVLLTRGLAEGARLAEALGAQARTMSGLSGVGDWTLTTLDPDEPLCQAGARLSRGEPLAFAEAGQRVRTLCALGERSGVDLPIVRGVAAILDGTPVDQVMHALMTRRSVAEFT